MYLYFEPAIPALRMYFVTYRSKIANIGLQYMTFHLVYSLIFCDFFCFQMLTGNMKLKNDRNNSQVLNSIINNVIKTLLVQDKNYLFVQHIYVGHTMAGERGGDERGERMTGRGKKGERREEGREIAVTFIRCIFIIVVQLLLIFYHVLLENFDRLYWLAYSPWHKLESFRKNNFQQ